MNAFILQLKPSTAKKYDISEKQIRRIRKCIREGVPMKPSTKTMKRLNKCYAKEKEMTKYSLP